MNQLKMTESTPKQQITDSQVLHKKNDMESSNTS